MFRALLSLAPALLLAGLALPANAAGERHALVVGVNAYTSHAALKLAVPDANLVGSTLESLGFEVDYVLDPTRETLVAAVAAHAEKVDGDDISVFYFAGTGIEQAGVPLMFGTDFVMEGRETPLAAEGVSLLDVIAQVEAESTGTNIFIFDACRNDPDAAHLTRGLSIASPASSPATSSAYRTNGRGTFIMYSTSPGSLVYEGSGNNSLFATALSRYLGQGGWSLSDIAREVRFVVSNSFDGKQVPGFYDATDGEIYLDLPGADEEEDESEE